MLLPGPEAQQLATYIGWLLHGTRGALVAGSLFVLPGFIAILALSLLYALYQDTAVLQAVFYGLKAAVLAIVLDAVIRIGKRVMKNATLASVGAAAFAALFFFNIPFPIVILAAGALGFIGGHVRPDIFQAIKPHAADGVSPCFDVLT
jgi:chromate transporter